MCHGLAKWLLGEVSLIHKMAAICGTYSNPQYEFISRLFAAGGQDCVGGYYSALQHSTYLFFLMKISQVG